MAQFQFEKVRNPEYFQENRLPAHADFVCYADWEEQARGTSSLRLSLDGLWKFAYARNPAGMIPEFWSADYDCHSWEDIRVPAHIQMEGYDAPQYVNVQYPWSGREEIEPGQIPEHFNPVAQYVRYITLPDSFRNQPVCISFQGAESALALWCNGHFVGYSEDSFTPSEFELTPYLQEGENKLAVLVYKWSSSSWCEDQDFFRFSGIFRSVYLYRIPAAHVRDIKVQTTLSEDLGQAVLELNLETVGAGEVSMELCPLTQEGEYRPEGGFYDVCGESIGMLASRLEEKIHLELEVLRPLLWSAETPNLYALRVQVADESGAVCEVFTQPVGFRRFELKDGLMLLNGKRIVFKGVNRHEFSSSVGRVPDEAELWQDLTTMKRHNINAVRTCHYPDQSRLYELCDRLGLYLIDECNLESHGSWEPLWRGMTTVDRVVPGDRPEWTEMMLDRINSMYQRDKNHPAILIWSCGNESYGGLNLLKMSKRLHELDPGRLVHYEGIFHDRRYPETSDMESQMYTPVAGIESFLAEHPEKPFICCEYTHAMGNSCGAMHKYTDLTEREPRYQGGFIWDYVDQSIYKKNRYGETFQAYGGDFDDRPSDYQFSGNGIVYGGDRTPSPKMQEVKFNYQNISVTVEERELLIRNRNLFVNTDQYDCVVRVERYGKLLERKTVRFAVEPLSEKTFQNPAAIPEAPGEYVVTVSFCLREDTCWAPAGHEAAFGQGVFRRGFSAGELLPELKLLQPGKLQFIRSNFNMGVRGEQFEVLLSATGLESYRYGGREMLRKMPAANFWRAPVDNDCGNDMMGRCGQWKLASLYQRPLAGKEMPEIQPLADGIQVCYHKQAATNPVLPFDVIYRIYGDGTVAVTLSLESTKGLEAMPEFGMCFLLDADYDRLEWYGNGPEETYSDRQKGAKLGVFRNLVADNMARYLVPQECGNKTMVRYAKVTDRKGRGMLFAAAEMNFSALPYTPHELENAAHPYELPPVHYTCVRAALAQMGVGGDDSWGSRVHPEYLIDTQGPISFTVYLKGI